MPRENDYDTLMLESQTDLGAMLAGLTDKQRIAAVRIILGTLEEEGTIAEIRSIAGQETYDD